ncbi:MAG: sigma-70 family RNA polymerase sigma factor [Planctomycetaceae bacterium]|nr:sigma-70 family RNA polymerase sigma factor [Planctomycetaceae bacterium]
MEDESDDDLMIRLQSGETDAFDTLVERYQGRLIGFFMRNTRDIQFAEDLAQETLLKVYNQAWNYMPQNRFRGWMFQIGRNLLIDNVRRRSNDALIRAVKRTQSDEQNEMARLAEELNSPDEKLIHQETSGIVDELLAELPPEQRETFELHVFSELSLPEVAEVTDVPLPTCKSRLRLAREKLVEKLKCRGIERPPPVGDGVV